METRTTPNDTVRNFHSVTDSHRFIHDTCKGVPTASIPGGQSSSSDDEDAQHADRDTSAYADHDGAFSENQLASQEYNAELRRNYCRTRFLRSYWLVGAFSILVVFGIFGFTWYGFVIQACLSILLDVG